jgi:hypothetical protein
MTVAAAVGVLPRRMAGWAARQSLAPNALTGIALACSICAAAWFSAGTRSSAVAGGLALSAGYLARRVGAQVTAARGSGAAAQGTVAPVRADLSTLARLAPVRADRPMLARFEAWLAGVGAAAGELAIYAGLAAGASASQRHGIWILATDAVITLSIGQVAPLGRPGRVGSPPPRSWWPQVVNWLLTLPMGERIAVIAVTAPLWGARTTFLALIAWGAVAAGWAVVQGARAWGGRPDSAQAGPGGIAARRDDGPVARLAGQIVRGQLVPLPPALAGLTAAVLLVALGLGNLTGILVLAPVAAMLLAAPGAGHPHDGPLDWLVPLLLQAGQFIYLAALGFSAHVPGPVTFGLISVVALRQLDVACRAQQQTGWPAQPAGLGWDGRILAVAFAAMLGLVTFAYLAMTAYLGWLLCRVSLSGWLAAREPDISRGDCR